MPDETSFEKIKEQFFQHSDKMLERDIQRLGRFGEIEFDAKPYLISPAAFAEELRPNCHIVERAIDASEFESWYQTYDYEKLFPEYCKTYTDKNLLKKKAFEHWLSIKETEDAEGGDFLDVGCATSPFHQLEEILDPGTNNRVFRVDLPLPEYGFHAGVNGNVIGCTADQIPLEDESVARIYSHNAIEHFEGPAYIGLFREAARLLKPGGVIYICPLFPAAQTFSFVSLTGIYRRLHFPDIPAGIKLVYSDSVGQPFSLFVDAKYLTEKIVQPLSDQLDFSLIQYPEEVATKYKVGLGLMGRKK